MLLPIVLPDPVILPDGPIATFLEPIAIAATCRESVSDALAKLVSNLGFQHFTYGTGSVPTPTRESRSYVWTNAPLAWVQRYDQMAYIEVDPRVSGSIDSAAPMLWDRFSFPDTRRRREYFDDAARYGVCSGVAVGLRDPRRAQSGFYLNSDRPRLDDGFRTHCAERQGEILLLAHYVHAMLTASVVDREQPPPTAGAPLSPRERECLQLAAKGLSSSQIAKNLGIGERTVHFHFSNLLSKLNANNRHQAIAKAVAAGLVEP
jgi:LuxR family quorum-sensing system transcriptional regulator SolR